MKAVKGIGLSVSLILGMSIIPHTVFAQLETNAGFENTLRAQVVPVRHAVISAEMDGKIDLLPVHEGDRFKKGDILTGFDCAKEVADLQRISSRVELADKELNIAKQLDSLGTTSVMKVVEAKSQVQQIQAEIKISQVLVQRCKIQAPYSGRVAELFVQPHQFVARGEKLMRIIDPSRLEIEMIIPSRWLSWLRVGFAFALHLDETSKAYQAQINKIGAWIDPISQSVKIRAKFLELDRRILSGMSGRATLMPLSTSKPNTNE